MKIRKYAPSDREAVLKIHFETYFMGKSISALVDNKKYIDEEINYYLNKEPESIFVAENNKKIVGYLLGCLDDKNNPRIKEGIIKNLKTIARYPFMTKKDRKFWGSRLSITFKILAGKSDELKMKIPENTGHLHINLLPEARGKGTGTKLLKEFFKYAKSKGTKNIHADSFETKLNPNKNFWIKNGFKTYSRGKSLFWKSQYPKEKIGIVCYAQSIK